MLVIRGRVAQDVCAKLEAADLKVLFEIAFINQFGQEEFSVSISSLCWLYGARKCKPMAYGTSQSHVFTYVCMLIISYIFGHLSYL